MQNPGDINVINPSGTPLRKFLIQAEAERAERQFRDYHELHSLSSVGVLIYEGPLFYMLVQNPLLLPRPYIHKQHKLTDYVPEDVTLVDRYIKNRQ